MLEKQLKRKLAEFDIENERHVKRYQLLHEDLNNQITKTTQKYTNLKTLTDLELMSQ